MSGDRCRLDRGHGTCGSVIRATIDVWYTQCIEHGAKVKGIGCEVGSMAVG